MAQRTECPKCASSGAWLVRTEHDLVLKCMCGLYKVLYSTLESMVMQHTDFGEGVKLPKRGTKLWDTLMVLQTLEPASTGEVTERLILLGRSYSTSDVSSYLTILRSKGLVRPLESKRGVVGGSTWEITDAADSILSP